MSRFYYPNDEYVDLYEKDPDRYYSDYNCPQEGSFNGWKVAMVLRNGAFEFCLVQLRIPDDSPRLRAYRSRKCRCKYATVVDIQLFDGSLLPDDTVAYSMYEMTSFADPSLRHRTKYKKGEVIFSDGWDADRTIECGHGIHFFMAREDAISFVTSRG